VPLWRCRHGRGYRAGGHRADVRGDAEGLAAMERQTIRLHSIAPLPIGPDVGRHGRGAP